MVDVVSKKRFAGFRVIGRAVLFMVVCAVILAAAVPWIPKLNGMWTELCLGFATAIGTLLLSLAFVCWDRISANDVGVLPDRRSGLRLLLGFVIGITLVGGWALVSTATGYVRWDRGPGTNASAMIVALLAYFALACREELAFHGYPLRRLQDPLGVWGAQLFVAVVFALEHRLGGYDWLHAIFGPGVGSLLFGMAAIATRGLAVPIGIHTAWNFGQWLLGLRGHPAIWRAVVDENRSPQAEFAMMAIYVVLVSVATLGFWMWYRRAAVEVQNAALEAN
jgi:membrane protease YdiL (CAAX protease family)